MNERRRQELRKRYIRLTNEVERIMDTADCGRALLTTINPRLGEIERELQSIEAEVEAAMAMGRSDPLL